MKGKHEISRGKMTALSPLTRFPKGMCLMHFFATNVPVLQTIRDVINQVIADHPDDARTKLMPLLCLHRPMGGKKNHRPTALHVALEKQSPIAFDTMLEMLTDQRKVCITKFLLDRLGDMIDAGSPIVNQFFDECFFVTD